MKKKTKTIVILENIEKILKDSHLNNSHLVSVKGDSKDAKKKDEEMTLLAGLVDIGLTEYEIEWQRIATMQQSASILIGIIAIVYSANFIFLPTDTFFSENVFNYVVRPTVILNTLSIVISLFYFLKLILPRHYIGLNTPINIYKDLKTNSLFERLYELIHIIGIPLKNINNNLNLKHEDYFNCLRYSFYTLLIQLVLIGSIFAYNFFNDINICIYYVLLSFISLIYFIFFHKQNVKGVDIK